MSNITAPTLNPTSYSLNISTTNLNILEERKSITAGESTKLRLQMFLFLLSHQGPARKPEAYGAGSHYLRLIK